MITPKRVIHPSSSNTSEILVACEDENGHLINVTIVDEKLGAVLADTPQSIPNPEYQPLVDRALTLATKSITAAAEAKANG